MAENNTLKYAALAGAGWFIYRNFFSGVLPAFAGGTPPTGPAAAPPIPASAAPAPAPAPPAPAPAPAAAPPAAAPPAPSPSNVEAINKALEAQWNAAGKNVATLLGGAVSVKSKAGDSGAYRLNFHQWNYYRQSYADANSLPLPVYSPDDLGEGDGSKLYTAADYQGVLLARGEPGALGLGGIVPVGSPYMVNGYALSTRPVLPFRLVRGY